MKGNNLTLKNIFKYPWRLIVIVVGFTVLIIGILMIVLPGPAFIVIPLGLSILATEFIWARRLLKKMKDKAIDLKDFINNNKTKRPDSN